MLTEAAARIDAITEHDVPAAMTLASSAGWNQIDDDWSMLLRLGRGYGVRDQDERLIASSVIMPYAPSIGWIGMVLVDATMRRRGLASSLLDNAIASIQRSGLISMLDATPAGREVYLKHGFADVAPLSRWRGNGRGDDGSAGQTDQAEIAAAVRADEMAFGASRRSLLLDLSARPGAVTLALPNGRGAIWSRKGRTATQLGPLVAANEDDAMDLCAAALDRIGGPILLDVPDRETALCGLLRDRGFVVERPFMRMAIGGEYPLTLGPAMRVIAGPELG